MDSQFFSLKRKVDRYREVQQNTSAFREAWKNGVRDLIRQSLDQICAETGLAATTEIRSEVDNLEAVALTLGDTPSGLLQILGAGLRRDLIKHNGALIYQQLFNGKILVLIDYPFIENYGDPRPPKTIVICKPQELQPPFFIRHVEEWLEEMIAWEDYDDEEPIKRIGFTFGGSKKGEAGLTLESDVQ